MSDAIDFRIVNVKADPAAIALLMEGPMSKLGNALGKRMQRLVPKRTFALNDSISTETNVKGSRVVTTVTVGGGDVDYWSPVEYGTSRMAAQPFMRPAFRQATNRDLVYAGAGPKANGIRPATSRSRRHDRTNGGRS